MKFFQKRFFHVIAGISFLSGLVQAHADQVTAGSTVVLSVSADGTSPFTYQWIKDGSNLTGATSPTLSIINIQTSDGGSYSVFVANAAGSTTSSVSTITVAPPSTVPAITTQPVSQSVPVGANVTFTTAATGTPVPTYQWKKNGVLISGATNSSLSLTHVQTSAAATYTMVATNSSGSATSTGAVLTVTAATVAPVITTQPVSQSVPVGANVTFTTAATGTPVPTYQWKKNGVAISGATSSNLSLTNVQTSAAATYTMVATNSSGFATSTGAVLTVAAATVAPVITTQPVSQGVTVGANVTFTTAATGTPVPTYQWKKNGVAISGATSSSLVLANVQASASATYTVVATNGGGSVTSTGAVLTVAFGPVISAQPLNQTVLAGANVAFTVVADGSPAPSYQWRKNGTNINGATLATFSLTNVATGDAANYSVVITNSVGAITSSNAVLTVVGSLAHPVIGDFNLDGQVDLLWHNKTNGAVALWLMNGTSMQSTPLIGSVAANMEIAGTGDFNGDGLTDILWRNTSTGEISLWLMNGTSIQTTLTIGSVSLDWQIAGTGDFNGDGFTDILWRNTVNGGVALWYMNGVTVQSASVIATVTQDWQIAGTGDFNNDGQTDILWRKNLSGAVALWYMNGSTIQSTAIIGNVTSDWQITGTGDLNGDGKVDIVWRKSDGTVAFWLMNGAAIQSTSIAATVSADWQLNQ